MLVEIYRIAPGQHEAFMRMIALFDEANRRAGLPPRQLYVHQDGADWDFMLIQPAETPDDKEKALADAYKALNTPSGPNFFVKLPQLHRRAQRQFRQRSDQRCGLAQGAGRVPRKGALI